MDKELDCIRRRLNAELVDEKHRIYRAEYSGKRVVACVSGIGKVNSAVSTQRMICGYSPDYIINVGIAGGLDRTLEVLDVVIARETMYHDFYPLSLLEEEAQPGTSIFECDGRLVALAEEACAKLAAEGRINKFVKGRVLSGDCFVESDEKSRYLRTELNGSCVEMEGASISHTCLLNGIPFLVIRSISDFADNGAEMSYDTFAVRASEQAGAVLCEIINGL